MKRALLVVDVQNEYFSGLLPITHPQGHLTNILRSMDAAARAIPIVVSSTPFRKLTNHSSNEAHRSGNCTPKCGDARMTS